MATGIFPLDLNEVLKRLPSMNRDRGGEEVNESRFVDGDVGRAIMKNKQANEGKRFQLFLEGQLSRLSFLQLQPNQQHSGTIMPIWH